MAYSIMKNLFVSVLTFLLALLTPLMARCPDPIGQKPLWTGSLIPKDTEVSYFRVIYTEGQTLYDARKLAEKEVERQRANVVGGKQVQIQATQDSAFSLSHNNFEIKFDLVCEFHNKRRGGTYDYWQLVQIAKIPDNRALPPVSSEYFRKLEKAESIGLKPFIPGAAQFYKGSHAKGVMFIVGEAALIGGIVTAEVRRSSAESKINSTYNVAQRRVYIDDAGNMQNARNILIAGAAAIYVWNVIDGFVAKKPSDNMLAIMPYVDSHSAGLALTLNFYGR